MKVSWWIAATATVATSVLTVAVQLHTVKVCPNGKCPTAMRKFDDGSATARAVSGSSTFVAARR